MGIYSCFN